MSDKPPRVVTPADAVLAEAYFRRLHTEKPPATLSGTSSLPASGVNETLVQSVFKKNFADLYPSVQKLLIETAIGHPVHEDILKRLNALHEQKSFYGVVKIPHKGKLIPIDTKTLAPEPQDITHFFMHIARGMQWLGEQYGEDPHIHHLEVLDPREARNAFSSIRGIAFGEKLDEEKMPDGSIKTISTIPNVLGISLQRIYEAKAPCQNQVGRSPKRQRLGLFNNNDRLTLVGVEEADHAHWHNNPKEFEDKFGAPFKKEKIRDEGDNYDRDKLENHATVMMGRAINRLGLVRESIGR